MTTKASKSTILSTVPFVLAALALVIPAQAESMLYAPTASDNPTFRSELSALIGGPVDYWNAYTSGVPSLDVLLQYDAVFTWVNYPYADPVLMGDHLADYVGQGGRVILGAGCYPCGQSNYLQGRIMQLGYCPVHETSCMLAEYTGGGVDCVHDGVGSYDAIEITELQPDAVGDGLLAGGGWATAWRCDRAVYFSGGNTGSLDGSLQLTANMVLCHNLRGDVNLDGAVNGYDIDPFVIELTTPFPPDPGWCWETMQDAADINGDGVVNGYDIDPFVDCLISGGCGTLP
jgi:hypothetical protein